MKKFKIHYTFWIVSLLIILSGLFIDFLLIVFVLIIHEIGHFTFIKLFNYKITDIKLYPFGGVILYPIKNDFIYKELLITYAGVLFNLFFFIVFKLINLNFLSQINLYFFVINLLPISPLDGGKGLILLLSIFLPIKISRFIGYVSSIIFSIILIMFVKKTDGLYPYFCILHFIRTNITSLYKIKEEHQHFLLLKYLFPNEKLRVFVTKFWSANPLSNLFFGKNLIFDYDTFTVIEYDVLEKHFKNKKRLLN